MAVGSGGVRDAAVGFCKFLVVGCQGVFVTCGVSDPDVDLAGVVERLDVRERNERAEAHRRVGIGAQAEAQIGVARVSIASGATMAVMSLIKTIAEELHASRRFDGLTHSMTRAEAQALFKPRD